MPTGASHRTELGRVAGFAPAASSLATRRSARRTRPAPIWSGWRDLHSRHPRPKRGGLLLAYTLVLPFTCTLAVFRAIHTRKCPTSPALTSCAVHHIGAMLDSAPIPHPGLICVALLAEDLALRQLLYPPRLRPSPDPVVNFAGRIYMIQFQLVASATRLAWPVRFEPLAPTL